MKILLSNKQWQEIGKKAGWLKIGLHYNNEENIVSTPDTQITNEIKKQIQKMTFSLHQMQHRK